MSLATRLYKKIRKQTTVTLVKYIALPDGKVVRDWIRLPGRKYYAALREMNKEIAQK